LAIPFEPKTQGSLALVSTKKLSQKLAFGIAAHGLVTLAKKAYTHPTYDITHK